WGAPAGLSNYFGLGFKSVNTGGARVTGYEFELAGKGNFGPVEISTLLGYTHTTPVSTTPDQVYAVSPIAGSLSPPSTYTETSHDPSNNILKFRIQNLFRGDLQAQYKRFLLGGSVRYNSHVRNIDKAFITLDAPGLLPTGITEWMDTHKTGDVIVDARIGIELMEQLRVSFILNNLTNKTYSMRPLSVEAPRSMQVQMALSL
nr:TonB-dependent receptor [Flavobacteriales bacterium]